MDKIDIVKQAVAYIESLPNGANTTTNRVVHKIDDSLSNDFDDLMDLHYKIMDEIKKNNVVALDYSSHDDKVEGLPYNFDFIVER